MAPPPGGQGHVATAGAGQPPPPALRLRVYFARQARAGPKRHSFCVKSVGIIDVKGRGADRYVRDERVVAVHLRNTIARK